MKDELQGTADGRTISQIGHLNRVIMLGFVVVGLALFYWSVIRAQAILAHEDNPRLVEAELRIQRGLILDRHGDVLAETAGSTDRPQRVYPIPSAGPAVGYYSFRHGTAGIEESYDTILRGDSDDFWTEIVRQSLHQPQIGRDVRLTLDAHIQQTANTLIGNQSGAMLLINLPNSEILALGSYPSYDPNQLDDRFQELTEDERAPLLNRATQGQYQPGMALQPFIMLSALDQSLISLDDIVENSELEARVNDSITGCSGTVPEQVTWIDVLAHRCPGPMVALAGQLGATGLEQIFGNFGLTSAPLLPLNTETADVEPIRNPLLAAIGQESLTVTPLQLGLAWASLGSDGTLPRFRLVKAVQNSAGGWNEPDLEDRNSASIISPSSAQSFRNLLVLHEDFREHSTLVLSGPEGSTNAWYLGLAPAYTPRYAVVVIIEETSDLMGVEELGRRLLTEAQAHHDES